MSLELTNVNYTYMKKTPYERQALRDVSVTIEKGEFVAIIGHTGSGKSTLVQHLNGLLQPDTGAASVDGVSLAGKSKDARQARGRVGMVFQYPEHQLFAETVFEDVAFGPRNLGRSEAEVEQAVREALAFVNLDFDAFKDRSPFQLSGGQMRRVAIAGVVAMQPDYLILDEPSAGLDPGTRDRVFARILQLYRERHPAIILVTHNMDEAVRYASRLLVMEGGRLMLDGKPADIFTQHKDELLAASLDEPAIFKLMARLRARGIPLAADITTKEQLLAALEAYKHVRHVAPDGEGTWPAGTVRGAGKSGGTLVSGTTQGAGTAGDTSAQTGEGKAAAPSAQAGKRGKGARKRR